MPPSTDPWSRDATRLIRTMKRAEDGKPQNGIGARYLGIRAPGDVPEDQGVDVRPDDDGMVQPGQGVSVAPSVPDLPQFRRPSRLTNHPGKAGAADRVFALAESDLAELGLTVTWETEKHGVIGPAEPMPLEIFRARVAATRERWVDLGL